ncbi:UNVERIFIED_CONTAM: 1,4-beta-D-glucanase [Sesamum angustifolium]|uniref:1,4-beta-D-glucanase n=1 Tax=Sesamum angustifolium TaxID=2727405 RepID=A0AAW2QRV9_9LAMI
MLEVWGPIRLPGVPVEDQGAAEDNESINLLRSLVRGGVDAPIVISDSAAQSVQTHTHIASWDAVEHVARGDGGPQMPHSTSFAAQRSSDMDSEVGGIGSWTDYIRHFGMQSDPGAQTNSDGDSTARSRRPQGLPPRPRHDMYWHNWTILYKLSASYGTDVGPQCCENPPTLSPISGVGSVVEVAGLKTYVSGSSDSKLAILLASDVFGYEAPNLRKLADKVAAAGFYVVVPDFFCGDPYDPDNASKPLPVWKSLHEPAKACEDAKPIIEALKSKGISAIGAAGFCYGAKVVVELAKSGLIQAGVLLHPSFVTEDDIKEVKEPLAILGAEIDNFTPQILSESLGRSYQNLRYKFDDEKAVKSAEEAHEDMLNWFIKYVK